MDCRSSFATHGRQYNLTIRQESTARCIEMPDDDPDAVHAMLSFLYTGNYDDEVPRLGGMPSLKLHVLVFIMADKYNLPLLERKATNNFTARAANEWKSSAFADAVEEIYNQESGTKQLLRHQVIRICAANASAIFWLHPDKTAACGEKLRDIAETKSSFGLELLTAISAPGRGASNQLKGSYSHERRYKCPDCTDTFVAKSFTLIQGDVFHCPYCGKGQPWDDWGNKYRVV